MSKPKLFLVHSDGSRTKGELPTNQDALCAIFEGACAHCKATPLKVQGTGQRIASDDRAYEADGVAMCCSKFVGVIRVEMTTLFGLREDEAVLHGRCRVY